MTNCQNGDVHVGLAGRRSWSRVALLRWRSLQPRCGLFQDAFLRSLACDKRTTFSVVAKFKCSALYITDHLFLVGRNVVQLRPGMSNRILCRLPSDLAHHRSPPSFVIQREPDSTNSSHSWHPVLYGLRSLTRSLVRLDLVTGTSRHIELPQAIKFTTIAWETYSTRLVVATGSSVGEQCCLAVFSVEPLSLVGMVQLGRRGQFRDLKHATVRDGVLMVDFSRRRSHMTTASVRMYDFEELVQRHATEEAKRYLVPQDLFHTVQPEGGLPLTRVAGDEANQLAPFLTLDDVDLNDLELNDLKPLAFLARREADDRGRRRAKHNAYHVHSLPSGRRADYGDGAAPFECVESFYEEEAMFAAECPLLLYQSNRSIAVLRYAMLPGAGELRVTQCYEITEHATDDPPPPVPYTKVRTSSGRVVHRAVETNTCEWITEGLVKNVYVDADLSLLVATVASEQYDEGFVCFHDLASGKLLKKVMLEGWQEECQHNAVLLDRLIVHVMSCSSRVQTCVYHLTRPAPAV